jgi:beta-lactamase superfamily II metal-dependent hydrolase
VRREEVGYEMDVLAIGTGDSGGDAITLRYGNLHGPRSEQVVVVIDGGWPSNGKDVISVVKDRYGTEEIDLVISTHPDSDHVGGLKVVLEEMDVGELWMHKPWDYAESVRKYVTSGHAGGFTTFSKKLQAALSEARDLEQIATRRGIPIIEPFAGVQTADGVISVLGPSEDYYDSLAENFGMTPIQVVEKKLAMAAAKIKRLIHETPDNELLEDPPPNCVSNRNNSSTVLWLRLDSTTMLLTSDAGAEALDAALNVADYNGLGFADRVQIPHHGSRKNVGPTLLDRMLAETSMAFISAAEGGRPNRPAHQVLNAAIRRARVVATTEGTSNWYRSADVPDRDDYSTLVPEDFTEFYEDEE